MPDQLEITKAERARLRSLAQEAWESELRDALTALFEEFGRWADDGMSAFDLSDKIHEFHNGISRELYGRYTTIGPEILVSRAVALGIVDEGALGKTLLDKLARSIESFREMQDE
jgi:hypothetical protein